MLKNVCVCGRGLMELPPLLCTGEAWEALGKGLVGVLAVHMNFGLRNISLYMYIFGKFLLNLIDEMKILKSRSLDSTSNSNALNHLTLSSIPKKREFQFRTF